jgi:serine/threonine protein kinase
MLQLAQGARFQSYVVRSLVGVGGVSEVYAAEHAFTGNPCAIKLLQLRHVGNQKLTELARAEALSLSRIRHQNLVPVTDAGMTEQGVVWMVMPLLDGVTLRDFVGIHGRLSPLDALRIARDIADGTAAAHEVGIIHRDLKPENVVLTKRGEVVVLDLGMAKFQDYGLQSTGGGKALGTIRYMSPEHVLGKKVDPRTDVYALGVMLYEMLAGEHPFHAGEDGLPLTNYQVGLAHLTREPRRLDAVAPGLAADVVALVHRALSKDPAGRPASMPELAQLARAARKRLVDEQGGEGVVPSEAGKRRAYVEPRSVPALVGGGPAESARVIAAGSATAPPREAPLALHAPTSGPLASTKLSVGAAHRESAAPTERSPGARARPGRRPPLAHRLGAVLVGLVVAALAQVALHGPPGLGGPPAAAGAP